ncbi:hypothetical protein [Clostridium thermosuccinogenes]|uniref:hypothetical protein n=1 Tax=Clostridium thermosuccinogenes TaxID=84032 RepID=UPI00105700BC|nr:hypothetical protein [Pseudoclostridium thermosuccinogenes]
MTLTPSSYIKILCIPQILPWIASISRALFGNFRNPERFGLDFKAAITPVMNPFNVNMLPISESRDYHP